MESDREKGMEELEMDLQLDKALTVIWSEIHCLHDGTEFMMDLMRNVNEQEEQASPHPMYPPFPSLLVSQSLCLG